MIHLVIGGARSGKSRFAEQSVLNQSVDQECAPYYLATAEARDAEMQARIRRHQSQRDKAWKLVEVTHQLEQTLHTLNHKNNTLLIDCMTLWLNHILERAQAKSTDEADHSFERDVLEAKQGLLRVLSNMTCNVTIVTNELGLGVVPVGQLTRTFVDQQGWLNQDLAAVADRVTLMVAGIASTIKPAVN